MKDTRFVYGATCTWFGKISEVGALPNPAGSGHPLPCCPLCHRVLFEMKTEAEWWVGVDGFERAGHVGYRAMLEWQRDQNKCFHSPEDLVKAYQAATGVLVAL